MGRLEELLPAAAWTALQGDIAELQRAADDDMFAEELRATDMVSRHGCDLHNCAGIGCSGVCGVRRQSSFLLE